MKTIQRYLLGNFCSTFAVTLLVLSFVISLGALFKLTDLIARGVPSRPIAAIFLLNLPQALAFSLPMSAMLSALLVFTRLSSDNEITAMRSCGISLWQIARPPLAFSIVLVALCLLLHHEIVPISHCAARRIVSELKAETPMALLEEGQFIQAFPGVAIYIGQRNGAHLSDIRIYDGRNPRHKREVKAKSGQLRQDDRGRILVDLYDARVDPFLDDRPGEALCRLWTLTLSGSAEPRTYTKKRADFTSGELLARIYRPGVYFPLLDLSDRCQERSTLRVEFHLRLVLSVSCFTFVFLGIPLGLQARRKQSSIGIALSLLIIPAFYSFVIVCLSFARTPEIRPHLIAWLPVAAGTLAGSILMRRAG